jgi:hypothetical protein
MQMQAGQLALAEKEAQVQKTQAEAIKAMREAEAVGQESGPAVTPLDEALKMAQLRKAQADAVKAEVEAQRSQVALQGDIMDLERKPLEAMHSEADLQNKLNPPTPEADG